MKKLTFLLALFAAPLVQALPVGNPGEASMLCEGLFCEGNAACGYFLCWDAVSFRGGYYGDFVSDRHLEVDGGTFDGKDLDISEIETDSAYLALNLWNRLDLFATFGASRILLQGNARLIGGGEFLRGARFEIRSTTDFSWSLGAHYTLWHCGCFTFGVEGHYFYTRPYIKQWNISQDQFFYSDDLDIKYDEWQGGVGVAYTLYNFVTPYIAIKWAHARLDMDQARTELETITASLENDKIIVIFPNIENQRDFGYAMGVSLHPCDRLSFTIERRFSDEKAFYINGQVRF